MNKRPAYLPHLTMRLAMGLGRLSPESRQRHATFIQRAQRDDGGFAGRSGESDLYYTSFALRALAVLGELYGEVAEKALQFLQSRLDQREKMIDHMSLVFGAALLDSAAGLNVYEPAGDAWKDRFADRLEQLRRDDGGYAKGPDGIASSTYYTFLSLLCLELLERPCPEPHRILDFVQSQRDASGGFREIRVGKRAGTNPTAAAIGILRLLGALEDDASGRTSDFLGELQDDDGGLLANTRIPIADLLSTFTGVLTLSDLGRLQVINTAAALRFARRLESPEGGFLAALWDETCDVEYTFYGLGCLGLLSVEAATPDLPIGG